MRNRGVRARGDGEFMTRGSFVDRWRLRIAASSPLLKPSGSTAILRTSCQRAVANGGVAIGTALIVPGDESIVERIREISDAFGAEVGVSAWNGFAMARFCAQDAARLRADMMKVLECVSPSGLPRLWLN